MHSTDHGASKETQWQGISTASGMFEFGTCHYSVCICRCFNARAVNTVFTRISNWTVRACICRRFRSQCVFDLFTFSPSPMVLPGASAEPNIAVELYTPEITSSCNFDHRSTSLDSSGIKSSVSVMVIVPDTAFSCKLAGIRHWICNWICHWSKILTPTVLYRNY